MGIALDKHLNFNEHLKWLKSQLSKSVGILFKLNQFLPQNILKLLYKTLIKPYLAYVIEAWYSAPNYFTKQIFTMQKKSIRAILNLHFSEHTYSSFKNLKILKLIDLFRENITVCVYFYNTLSRGMNLDVSPHMVSHSEINEYNMRNRNQLVLPLNHKSHTQAGFLFQGIGEWNILTEDVKSTNSSRLLKWKLGKYFIENYWL